MLLQTCDQALLLLAKGAILNNRHFIVLRFGCGVRQLKPIKVLQAEHAKVRG